MYIQGSNDKRGEGKGLHSCPRSGWAVGHFVSNYGGGMEISNPLPVYWERLHRGAGFGGDICMARGAVRT